jgi:hypothetical protein
MGDNRNEQTHGSYDPHDPVSARGEVSILIGEKACGEGPSHKKGNDDPGPLDIYFEAKQPKYPDAFSKHRTSPVEDCIVNSARRLLNLPKYGFKIIIHKDATNERRESLKLKMRRRGGL